MRVLPAETVTAIQDRILAGASIRQIMGECGVAKGTVTRYRGIVLGKPNRATRRYSCEPILEAQRSIVARYDKNTLRLQKDVDGLTGGVSYSVTLVRGRTNTPPRSQRWTDLDRSAAIERFVQLYRQRIKP